MKKKLISIFIVLIMICNFILPVVSLGAETSKNNINQDKVTDKAEKEQNNAEKNKEIKKEETIKQEKSKEESKTENIKQESTKQNSNAILTSSKYLVSELYKFVARILPDTPIQEFKKNLDGNDNTKIHVYNKDEKEELTSGIVSTGMLVKQENNPTTYSLSVIGDINEDAKVNQIDLNLLIKHIIGLKGQDLTGIKYRSGDLTGDDLVDQRDINVIIRYIVFGVLDVPEIERPKTPTITVISGEKVGENYVTGVKLKITSNEKDSIKTTYIISGSETKEETQIPKDGVISLDKKGIYQVLAYTYSKDGVKSMPTRININIKNGGPDISFAPNGNTTWKNKQTTKVTIEDVGTGIKEDSLKYAWVQGDRKLTVEEIANSFKNGQDITLDKGTGNDWHLWILAEDNSGNKNIMVSESFYIDNTDPEAGTVQLTQNSPDGKEYKENTITGQNVYVKLINGTDVGSGHKKTTYEVTGANTVPVGTTNDSVLTKEGTSKLIVTTEDNAGNITTRTYTIKISKSALEATILTEKKLTNEDIITYTIVFNKNVVGFTKEDIQIENGSLQTFKQEDETTFTITVKTEENQIGTQIITINEGTCNDEIGNSNKKATTSVTVDKVAPIATMYPNNGTLARNYTITVTVEDTGVGISDTNKYQYYVSTKKDALEGGAWTDYEPKRAFTIGEGLTGTYYIHLKTISDKAGNTVDVVSDAYVLDNTAPQVTFAENGNTTWQINHGTSVTVEDQGGSTLNTNSLKYMWSDNTLPPAENSFIQTFKNGQEIKKNDGSSPNYYLWILAKDELGNTQITRSNGFAIDNTAPTAGTVVLTKENSEGEQYVENTVTNQSIYVVLQEGTDLDSGHSKTTYEVTGANTVPAGTKKPCLLENEGHSIITVTTVDNVGNISKRSYTIKIDKVLPVASIRTFIASPTSSEKILYTINFTKPVNGFTADDINVINGVKGIFSKISDSQYQLEVGTSENQHNIQEVQIPAGVCFDMAGNPNTETSYSIEIDRVAPTIYVTPYGSSNAQRTEVTITVNDVGSGLTETNMYQYYISTSPTETEGGNWIAYESGVPFEIGEGITGTVYIHIRGVMDKAGNAIGNVITSAFIFSNDGPTVQFVTNGSTTWAQSHSTVVNVIKSGATVDTSSLKYVWTQSTTPPNVTNFVDTFRSGDTISLDRVTGNNWYLWVIAQDTLGNMTLTRSEAFYLDNEAPVPGTMIMKEENAQGANYNAEDITDKDLYIELVDGKENESGIKSNSYEVTGANTVPAGTTEPTILKNKGTSIITVTTVDLAGNVSVRNYTIYQDKTGPNIEFVTNGNSGWSQEQSTVVIVEDIGGSAVDAASLKYVWTHSTIKPKEDEFINTFSNGSEVLNEDGETGNNWYLWIWAKDLLGNETIARSNSFYIDNTPPVIHEVDASLKTDTAVFIQVTDITDVGIGNVGMMYQYYCSSTDEWSSWTVSPEYIIGELEPETTYTFKVRAKDAADNESEEFEFEVTTEPKQKN